MVPSFSKQWYWSLYLYVLIAQGSQANSSEEFKMQWSSSKSWCSLKPSLLQGRQREESRRDNFTKWHSQFNKYFFSLLLTIAGSIFSIGLCAFHTLFHLIFKMNKWVRYLLALMGEVHSIPLRSSVISWRSWDQGQVTPFQEGRFPDLDRSNFKFHSVPQC